MRILFFSFFYKGAKFSGGPIYSVSSLAERLADRGHEVHVVTSDYCRELSKLFYIDNGVTIHVFKTRSLVPEWSPVKSEMLRTYVGLNDWIEQHNDDFDVVIVRNTYHPHLSDIVCNFKNAKKLYYGAGELNWNRVLIGKWKKYLYLKFIEIPSIRKFDYIVCLTPREKHDYKFWKLKNDTVIIPNGIDVPSDFKGQYTSEEIRFCYFGRVHSSKGIYELLEAFMLLKKSGIEGWSLRIAGSVEESEVEFLNSKIEAIDSHLIQFKGCITDPQEKADFLQASDVFLLPTVAEGMSVAMLEAMANRNAIITTEGSNMGEYVNRGCGIICEKNAESILKSIKSILRMKPADLDKMKEVSHNLALSEFNWGRVVDKFEILSNSTFLKT